VSIANQVILNLVLKTKPMGAVEAGPESLLISTSKRRRMAPVAVRRFRHGHRSEHVEALRSFLHHEVQDGVEMGRQLRSISDAHGGRLWADAITARRPVFQFTCAARQGANEILFAGSADSRAVRRTPYRSRLIKW